MTQPGNAIPPPVILSPSPQQHADSSLRGGFPRLLYPIIHHSSKPVATEPIILDDTPGSAKTPLVPKSFCARFMRSLTSTSNTFQVYDLVDQKDTVTFKCPRCQYEGPSRPMNTLGPCTYFGIVALCCLCLPCGVVPCFCKKCQYIQHYCPQCGQRIGVTYPG